MRKLWILAALCLLPSIALARQQVREINIATIAAGDSVVCNWYAMPTGASDVRLHYEGTGPKPTVRADYKIGAGAWATSFSDAINCTVYPGANIRFDTTIGFTNGAVPAGISYRIVFKNLHGTAPVTSLMALIMYEEPNEVH